jgi:hypothetical protein
MALRDALNKKKQEEQKSGINHNPEVDARIDKFIADNPEVYAKIAAYTHEELVRKRVLAIMNTNERREGYREEVRAFVEQNPEIKQEVERRMKRIPEDQRESAFVRVARNVAANFGMRQTQQPAQGMSAS